METIKSPGTLPQRMSDYIQNYFRSEFITDVRTTRNHNGELIYIAEISHDNTLYNLRFDKSGNLLHLDSEPALELYNDYESYRGLDD